MTNTKSLMQILLSEGIPREIVFEFIEAAVETHLDEGTVEDFLLYGLVGAGIEIIAGSEVTQKVIKDGAEELLDTVNDIVLSPEAKELQRNARKSAKEATEEHIERTVKANAKEKLEGGTNLSHAGDSGEKPLQMHHYITNKSKTYTNQFNDITKKYKLDLDKPWNKDLLPHQGRHPNAYHNYLLKQIKEIENVSNDDKEIFLELFEKLKNEIKSNPNMLYKKYWKDK